MDIMKEIDRRIVFWDGGMGSLLQERGLRPGELPETWNILHPDIVTEIHREYIEAGADIIDTNTFGANRLKYSTYTARITPTCISLTGNEFCSIKISLDLSMANWYRLSH